MASRTETTTTRTSPKRGRRGGSPRKGDGGFWARLEKVTLAAHPRITPTAGHGDRGAADVPFSAVSIRASLPVCRTLAVNTLVLLRPHLLLLILAAPYFGWLRVGDALALALVWLAMLWQFDWQFGRAFGKHGRVRPGVYFKPTQRNQRIASQVPSLRNPKPYKATPWLWNGDISTLLPFMFFSAPPVSYVRRWVKTPASEGPSFRQRDPHPSEGQYAVALDVALPPSGHNPKLPCLLVLHGLNGGSDEPYVCDMVHLALSQGWTAAVMIARGLMGTEVAGDAAFHGARTSDVDASATALAAALGPSTPLLGVGYSMGAVIMNNYVAKAGDACPLWGAVSVGGTFDAGFNKHFKYSRNRWQPVLAQKLKLNFVEKNVVAAQDRGVDLRAVETAPDVVAFDTRMVVPYNGYQDVDEYYADMSANRRGKLERVRRPLLSLHAHDDPIMHVDGLPVEKAQDVEDLFFLVTTGGGHVGWPTGWNPMVRHWGWMSRVVIEFCAAVGGVAEDGDDGQ